MSAFKPINQADFGPCLGCFRQLDLVAANREESCFRLPFLSFRISRNDKASDKVVSCRHCGFYTDLASYARMQNQSKAIDIDGSIDTDTLTTTSNNEGSFLSGSRLLVEDIDDPSIGEECESLAGLLIAEKYSGECCKSCLASLSPNWRFCPHCGFFTEEIMPSSSYTDESTSMGSQSEESFQHLLIEPRQNQICKTRFGKRNRLVSPDKVGTVLSIFRISTPKPIDDSNKP